MDITAASSFFDDDPVYDAYTGDLLFYCHTTAHDDHTSSGATARRRTMSTEPSTTPPARRVITLHGEQWVVGINNPDSFAGTVVRRSYGLKKSTGVLAALSPAAACLGQEGPEFHAQREYFRDTQDARTSSDWDLMWNVFCPFNEPVAKGCFLRQGSSLMRVRNVYPSVDEFLIAEADQLDADASQMITFVSTRRDLVTEAPISVSIPTQAIQTDVMKYYEFRTLGESRLQPGDRTVFVAKSAYTPKVGAEFMMQGAKWRALAVVSEQDAWALHARLAS